MIFFIFIGPARKEVRHAPGQNVFRLKLFFNDFFFGGFTMTRTIAAVATAILAIFFIATISYAADSMLKAPISSVNTLVDKNGAPYVRIVVTEDRMLDGVKYQAEVLVMAFGSQATVAEKLKAGDELKAIVNGRDYQGNKSYAALKILN